MAAAAGMIAARRSADLLPGREDALYIADTIGELGLFYARASLALIGGSLVPQGGHNPIEAIKLGCPVLSGPHTANFKPLFAELAEQGGVRIVPSLDAVITEARKLLASAEARAGLHANAEAMVRRHEGALSRTLVVLSPYLKADA
jgi:3-deoxy-D-manno-octulosonic-acid transferase